VPWGVVQIRTVLRRAAAGTALLGLLALPRVSVSYDASIGWEPNAEAVGYTLFVRYAGSTDAEPIDVGSPTTEPDGLLRAIITNLPLVPGVYFSVAAYDAEGVVGEASSELSISYEQAAAVSDTDGDGLTDAQEDTDLSGTVDPGETDPGDADSDDDGLTDGGEVLVYGTDPLDPASAPTCSGDCASTCDAGCDDGNPCTLDRCELGACIHLPATAQCDDGISCTSFDACQDGVCGGVNNCPDGGDCDLALSVCKAAPIWVVAAFDDTAERRGAMTGDSAYAAGADDDPDADALAVEQVFALSTSNAFSGGSGDEVRYVVTLPSSGQWYLWGRFYWPGAPGSNDANSFLARVDGGPRLRFGNNRDYFRLWHWEGDGAVERGTPTPLALGELTADVHTIIIEKREVLPIPPRLDVFVLTSDPTWRPSDAAALAALGSQLAGPTASTTTSSTTLAWDTTTTTFIDADPTTTTLTEPESTTTTTTTLPPPPPTTTTTIPPECRTADDCADGDACTTDSCVSGACTHVPASGTACDDGDPCTVGDACAAGACAGWLLDCSHLNGPCTYGLCDPQRAECMTANVAAGASCDDGSACTSGDACNGGVCSGTYACESGTFCDAATKTCQMRMEVWLSAARDETAAFAGAMTSSTSYADGDDLDVVADSIEPLLVYAASTRNDNRGTSGDQVTYSVDLPVSGRWYLWGRFYYPGRPGSNDANSFFITVDGGSALTFGNNKSYFQTWHWGGDGRDERGSPVALPLGQLAAGRHTLRILKREVNPIAPRLDVMVLTPNATWVPDDADVVLP
jgi:hypothetical protein